MVRRQTIKDHFRESNLYNTRTVAVAFILFSLMLILVGRMFYLQVQQHQDFQTLSNQNRIKVIPIAPNRGLIYDRNGVILAENRLVFSLELIPEKINNIEQTLLDLQSILGSITDDKIEQFHQSRKHRRGFKQTSLISGLTETDRAIFAVNQYRFSGVSIEARLSRYYPFGENLVHALGYVGRINERDLANIDKQNYQATRHIGKVGLEKFYENILHGTIGYQEVETDVRGRVLRVINRKDPIPGQDIHLHIDSHLQLEITKLLKGRRGAVIAVDPNNGAVLSLVSSPAYEPNAFVQGISSKAYSVLLKSQDRPLFNRALRGQYSPGSTIKPMLGLLGLEEGVIEPATRIWDKGFFQLEGKERRYRDWQKEGHGWVNLTRAIIHSCDTFYYELALKLGIDKIYDGMHSFGFGQLTNIDMGEEVPALMPSRGWKQADRNQPWYPGETIIIGIGQGYWNATPLQLVSAIAIMANGGTRYDLNLAKAIGPREKLKKVSITVAEEQIFDFTKKNFALVNKAMRGVNSPGGTAYAAFRTANFTSAGKSGTVQLTAIAQDEEYDEEKLAEIHRDNALFVAYAPYKKPKIAISVIIENAGGGSANAAPLARKAMEFYLKQETSSNVRVSTK
ncbi:MAG: penicillin-binding protein 2 [Gammaproteobacteria bacterium]|nr:MAG: penicillin-binding protein 2 [Gammaproteobacteria bacterium]